MKSDTKSAPYFFGALLLLLALGFQNCSNPSSLSSLENSRTPQKSATNPITEAGNGEGYGGKLNGIYASVDGLNQCGRATATQVPIREQIEIQNGMALKTIENCRRLALPKAVPLASVQASSQSGHLFILQDQIFERAKWVPTGFAPRDQYVDYFCMGEDLNSGSSIQRNLELSIFSTKANPYAHLPGMEALPSNLFVSRRAEMLMVDQNIQTSEIIKTESYAYDLRESMSVSSSSSSNSGSIYHSFELAPNFQNPNDLGFELSFTSTSYGSIKPIEMNYGTTQTLQAVSDSVCWSH